VLPRRLEDLRPARGVSGTAGRTVRALDVTLDDLVLELNLTGRVAGAGLRGGSYRLGPRGLRLSGVEVVPGVRVSGAPRRGGALRLRVRGSAAADGTVELGRDGSLRGRLGGKRVRTRLRGGPPTARATATASRRTPVRLP
jgi:hypothetical protein